MYILENLRRYRNLWAAEYHPIAGENLYNAMYRQISTMFTRNKELAAENASLKQEIIKLSKRGEN